MELRSQTKVSGTSAQSRATSEGREEEKVGINRMNSQADDVNSTSVNSPSSAIGITRGGKEPSRIRPAEGGQFRAVAPQPRNESAGGADTSPGDDLSRRRGQCRESGDADGRATPGRELELAAATGGRNFPQPDEGQTTEFTMVPEVESLTRSSATASPTSARRESADSDASYSTMLTSGADFQPRSAATQTTVSHLTSTKQSTPGPFQAAMAGINPTKVRRLDLGVDSEVKSTHLESEVTDCSQFRPAITSMAPHHTTAKGLQTFDSYG